MAERKSAAEKTVQEKAGLPAARNKKAGDGPNAMPATLGIATNQTSHGPKVINHLPDGTTITHW